MNNYSTFVVMLIGFFQSAIGFGQVNGFDPQGRRDGSWQKYYEGSQQLRYQGQFDHGKEVGVFKFYCRDCGSQPTAIREFNAQDQSVRVSYFTKTGQLVAQGHLIGQKRDGIWVTFHKNSSEVMSRENYKNGFLEGLKETFYPNGILAESVIYAKNILEGAQLFYGHNGQLIKSYIYEKGQLHGPALFYDAAGQLTSEGQYKRDKKHGLWRYYDQGVLIKEEHYPKPFRPQ
ncbi:MAG: hypothetical protein P8O93_04265 [Flavobacteriaceae bacterium]|jgi:antitoxin component YwqK of YwqJK toxin-antitoxin module|nr:hypothetical protein [Flavobacteriaceae bacterium]MDG1962049.1 hypothetical protein [Flavobacteriaceae bacterium]